MSARMKPLTSPVGFVGGRILLTNGAMDKTMKDVLRVCIGCEILGQHRWIDAKGKDS